MVDGLLLGIDVGTTAVKAGLFTRDGEVIGARSVFYPTARLGAGVVEQNPNDWMRAIDEISHELLSLEPSRPIEAVGICSQVNTHVFVDGDGSPTLPAIVWQDGRAAPEAASIDADVDAPSRLAWWGAPIPIDASHALSRMKWVAKHRPDCWARTRWVLSPKDYCLLHLTGMPVADPIAAIGLVDLHGAYIEPLLDHVPGARHRLAPLRGFDQVVGCIRIGPLARFAPPVVTGTMDAWGGLFGAGSTAPGQGAYLSGTSETIVVISDTRIGAPGVITFLPVNGLNVHAGPTQAGGDSLRFLAQITGRSIEQLLTAAAHVDRDSASVVFLPHLQGERAPLWDPHSRGAFIGLSANTGVGELTLAVLEGVACSAGLLLDAASEAAGMNFERLRMGGGGSKSDLWCQIRADLLGVTLDRPVNRDVGTLGAAMMAGLGAGIFATPSEAAQRMVRIERSFVPDPRTAERYARIRGAYRDLYDAVRPVHLTLGF
jgi:xylulokinase